jgi:hypothetical protein
MWGPDSGVETLYKEVLSWPVINMLKRNHRLVKVMVMSLSQQATFLILHTSQVAMLLQLPTETIPNEFGTWKEYKESFRNSTLEEIWHQIDLGMDTISTGLYVHSFETTTFRGQKTYNITLKAPTWNMPKPGDLMLFTTSGLQSRDQIIKDGCFCAILVVCRLVSSMLVVRLSQLPFGGKPNQKSSYQVMHLASLKTYESSWEVMMRGSRKSSELCNLILTKNTNRVCTDISLS